MKIGLISDTHSFLDEAVFTYFKDVDELWHAGDIGSPNVLSKLEGFKPTLAVFGNIDDRDLQSRIKENVVIEREGVQILITHIAGKPPSYNTKVKNLIKQHNPTLLVCGHSHILKVMYDKENALLFMNPGAAGKQGFHQMRTIMRFDLINGRIENLEVVELGKR